MNTSLFKRLSHTAFLAGGLCAASLMTGCYAGAVGLVQSTVGGQTLPSPYYLRDDVQFFPAGPEDQLPNLRRALEEYRLEQQDIREGLVDDVP